MNKRKCVFYKKEVNLIRNSNLINMPEYECWKKVVFKKAKIYEEDILKMELSDDEKSLIKNTNRDFYSLAHSEWKVVKQHYTGEERCTICNAYNNLIFYIENIVTGKRINVGSTCINGFINKKDKDIVNYISNTKKQSKEMDLKNNFLNAFPGTEDYLKDIEIEYKRIPYVLPSYIDNTIIELKEKQRQFYYDYIKGKIPKKSLSEFSCLKNAYIEGMDNASKWIEENASNSLSCSKEIANWIVDTYGLQTLEQIKKNNGFIPNNLVIRVYHRDFVLKNFDMIKKYLYEKSIDVSFNDNKFFFKIENRYLNKLTFTCTSKQFMFMFSSIIYDDKYNISFNLLDVSLEDDTGFIHLIKNIENLYGQKYKFSFESGINRLHINDNISTKYLRLSAVQFMHNVGGILYGFNNNVDIKSEIEKYLFNLNWMNSINKPEETFEELSRMMKEYK